MRKLATVRRISDIRPIENADLIELAVVDGWQCVVKKGTHEVGELVVYCEIDTVLPVKDEYEFLRKSCYVQRDWLPQGEGFRLKTIKLRGQVSQGLLLPVGSVAGNDWVPTKGEDVSDVLGIVKWEPPVPKNLAGMVKGNFPTYIPKTDQERVQNLVREVFSVEQSDVLWEVTLKLDGSSCTYYHKDREGQSPTQGRVGACSRALNLKLEQEGNAFVDTFHKLGLADRLPLFGNIALQGELMGPKIQGNREGFPDYQYYVYDIWDIDKQAYLPSIMRYDIVRDLGLQMVPVIHPGATLQELGCDTLEGMLQYADRGSINHEVAEGVVFKNVWGTLGEAAPPYSFKCISNRYLLREK